MRELLRSLGGAVEFGTVLETFGVDEDSVTAVVARDGKRTQIRAGWLVGADGGHSTVRKGAGIPYEGETREDVRMIVADVSVDGLDREAWHMWRHAEGMVTLCPLPSTELFQYQASIAPGQDPDTGITNMQTILRARSGRSDILLRHAEWRSLWRANVRLADKYAAGRVLLAGDAAHIHSPAGGQGMNTGIQDAHNLGWKLAAVERDGAPATLIDSYGAERRPVAKAVLALSDARLRQAFDGRGIPIRSDATTMQLTVGYRGSVLARDGRDENAAVRAGDRYPDVPGLRTIEGEVRLFDLTRGGHWTLLRFGSPDRIGLGAAVHQHSVVDEPVTLSEIGDVHGRLTAAFEVAGDAAVLLRPDGCIAAIDDGTDMSDVREVLELVGAPLAPVRR